MFSTLESMGASRVLFLLEPSLGLRAVLAIDDLTLGPGVGGIRTRSYDSVDAAAQDAVRLARAMTVKCALAGLDAGGAKMVVIDHVGLDREKAFRWLGERIQELGGIFRTAGDLGTTANDLRWVAERTEYVHLEDGSLANAVAQGLAACLDAALHSLDRTTPAASVAVQGAGAIGSAVARTLVERGMQVSVADVDAARAQSLAREIDARVVATDEILLLPVDVVAPCAVGGVIDAGVAERLPARAVVGAANNILASPEAARILHRRGVVYVPDTVASAGAVVAGISRTVMGVSDPTSLILRLGDTAAEILAESRATDRVADEVASAKAWARINAARRGS